MSEMGGREGVCGEGGRKLGMSENSRGRKGVGEKGGRKQDIIEREDARMRACVKMYVCACACASAIVLESNLLPKLVSLLHSQLTPSLVALSFLPASPPLYTRLFARALVADVIPEQRVWLGRQEEAGPECG